MVPTGAPAREVGAAGATGRGGALYTGRGPVCGTIMRGAGFCGVGVAAGIEGRGELEATGGAGGAGGAEAVIGAAGGEGGATTAAGGAGGTCGRTGGAVAAGTAGAGEDTGGGTGFSTAGGGTMVGLAGAGVGATTEAGGAGGAGFGAAGTIAGFGATGGAAGFTVAGAAASFFCVIAFSTSPGREICDRSILVLISSSPRGERAERAEGPWDSAEPRI